MKLFILFLAFVGMLCAQTADFPAQVATDATMFKAANNLGTKLTVAQSATDTVLHVQSAAGIIAPVLVSVGTTKPEIEAVCAVNGNTLTIGYSGFGCPSLSGRGFNSTAAVAHPLTTGPPVNDVNVNVVAWYVDKHRLEIEAIENLIGANGANLPSGAQGPAGQGVPAGGTAGQVVSKIDTTDYHTQWVSLPNGMVYPSAPGIAACSGTPCTAWVTSFPVVTTLGSPDVDTNLASAKAVRAAITAVTASTLGLGAVENTALSTWPGTTNINTLGTITSGVWHGTLIADTYISSAAAWSAKQAALTNYSTIAGLTGYPGTFPPVNSGNWAGTWQTYAPSYFQTAAAGVPYTGAVGDVNLGAHSLTATTITVTGSGPTLSTDIATPSTPAAGHTYTYTKAGMGCSLSPAGVETCTSNTASPGAPIPFSFYGGGSALIGPIVSCNLSSAPATINEFDMFATPSGTATITVSTVARSSWTGPSSATDISSGGETMTSATSKVDSALAGWNKTLPANTMVCVTLSSPSLVTSVSGSIKVN